MEVKIIPNEINISKFNICYNNALMRTPTPFTLVEEKVLNLILSYLKLLIKMMLFLQFQKMIFLQN